ncbi:LOW QUALITY PROTEIN: peptidyl-prolyl cis-trans isomerase-like 4 [Lepeophtheirus salmonis]|uniref:LOW QUALITY PROTEIN: peptidyl-prolyl cis-trans isomerase-like 4 n=1 Tax=Lepeophtheirus salmonis TaxID=72036 RepID=UPI001AEB8BC7|nr:LOW QUALITY PROTEIN: peptidyl-prolyl cis-trans isomerase sig-7-like [Lepeophtheirus salmonis]
MSVVLETTKGHVTIDLYTNHRPKVCENFLKLCKVKYYNYQLINSVQREFIAQTGDPTGTGRGGDSIFGRLYGNQAGFFEGDPMIPKIRHSKPGLISMVNTGSNLYGSQFFITLGSDLSYLDEQTHCVFGEIVEGMELLELLNETICDKEGRPYQDIRIAHTVILDDPYEDPPNLEIPPSSPLPSAEYLKTDRLAADEDFEEYEGKTAEELAEITAEKEAKARATILEMIGDLPDADCAPPENVLFVCKLNPVTTDEDLEIIFARFGKVVTCEVIRDRKTGDSLQYAFIEFDSHEACEKAYFKMDNVLIDDRRIHVDFSQSVSKYKWKGKGRLEVLDDSKKKDKNRSKGSRTERHSSRSEKDDFRSDKSSKRRDYSSDNRRRESDRRQNPSHSRSSRRDDSRDRESIYKRKDDNHERRHNKDNNYRSHSHRDKDRNNYSPERSGKREYRKERDSHQKNHKRKKSKRSRSSSSDDSR